MTAIHNVSQQQNVSTRTMAKYIRIHEYDANVFPDFDGSEVVVSERFVMFWKPPCPFDQWTASEFSIDDVLYNCAEQYMMAEKARLFGDAETEELILNSVNPSHQKKLGKRVEGFRDQLWSAERSNIVFRANVAKFTQNPELKEALLETGDRMLVEASPMDRIWGIGLAANDPDAYHPDKWPGLNLLGNVLTDVRAHIKAGQLGASVGG